MEALVSKTITSDYFARLSESFSADAVVVGGGPSGLVAACILAEKGYSVNVYEKNLAPGGGMWGGAMMFNSIVIEEKAAASANRLGIKLTPVEDLGYKADSVQATAALIGSACSAGVRIFNCMVVEDVTVDENRNVNGVVINWNPVMKLGMYVDPLMAQARCVLDATGHPAYVVTKFAEKNGVDISVPGERSLNVLDGENHTVEYTGEVYPGLFVSGMSACAFGGGYRMGPVFGGMLLSGEKAAEHMERRIKS